MKSTPWTARRPLALGFFALIMLVGGFGGWGVFSRLAGAIVAPGQIEVDQNRQTVQHPDGGVVAEILVDEGDLVAKGDLLIRLDRTLAQTSLASIENQLFDIRARAARLRAESMDAPEITFPADVLTAAETSAEVARAVQGQQRLFDQRRTRVQQNLDQLHRRIDQIEAQIQGTRAQKTALDLQLSLIREELTDQSSLLEKGLTQTRTVLALRRQEAEALGSLGELDANIARAQGQITETELEILKLQSSMREEALSRLRDLEYRDLELSEERATLRETLARMDIRAPVGGAIYGLQIFAQRAVIRAAEPILSIVPQDRPLVISANIDPTNIDQVYTGQEVVLKFSAFSRRTASEFFGHVTTVSADAFTNETTGARFYRVEIQLDPGELDKLGPGEILIPGMPVEAFIRTQDRSPIAYLVKPLTDYFAKAFRDG
jgi:HlyD family type I secretion membrane fusion protein